MTVTEARIIEDIAGELTNYLKSGRIYDLTSFTKEIDPNLNIDSIDRLLRIHFVLLDDVIEFVEQLPQRLRRIKTSIVHETEIYDGEVKGRVDWRRTITYRYNQNPNNKTLFVCNKNEKNYNIDENLVLKKLLQVIHKIIYIDLQKAFTLNYTWLEKWYKDKKLKEEINRVFFRNIYLKRIDLADISVTDRMIKRASRSRNQLYRESAILLCIYRRYMNYEFDSTEVKDLLRNTFIKPEKTSVLFELYWIIKIITQFKDKTNTKFQILERNGEDNIVATWELNGYSYKIYHNSTGSYNFKENLEDLKKAYPNRDDYITREIEVLISLENIANIKKEKGLWGGRPDIILERKRNGEPDLIFIGEVKYTDTRNYAIQGLKELLEYIALVKNKKGKYKKEKYIENYEDLFDTIKNIKGALFTDKIENLNFNINDDNNIKVYMYGDKLEELVHDLCS